MTPDSTQTSDDNLTGVGHLSDLDLIGSVVTRSEDAFAELFRRHSRSVAAATRMILGNRPECDDVVAEVFVGIWLSPERFEPGRGSLLSFLRLTARSRSVDLVRSETARVRREKLGGSGSGPSPDSDDALLASEATTQLHDALALLPPHEREPIELAYFHGMTYRDVAVHLALPEGTVKSRIRSGLRKLRMDDDIRSHAGVHPITSDD